jgi:hypothetical protein
VIGGLDSASLLVEARPSWLIIFVLSFLLAMNFLSQGRGSRPRRQAVSPICQKLSRRMTFRGSVASKNAYFSVASEKCRSSRREHRHHGSMAPRWRTQPTRVAPVGGLRFLDTLLIGVIHQCAGILHPAALIAVPPAADRDRVAVPRMAARLHGCVPRYSRARHPRARSLSSCAVSCRRYSFTTTLLPLP